MQRKSTKRNARGSTKRSAERSAKGDRRDAESLHTQHKKERTVDNKAKRPEAQNNAVDVGSERRDGLLTCSCG